MLSPTFSNRQSITQSFDRWGNVNVDNTRVGSSVLVPSITKVPDLKLIDFTKNPRFISRSKYAISSSNSKMKLASPDSFR